jgi:hypothetical protein
LNQSNVVLVPVPPEGKNWQPVVGACTQSYFGRLAIDSNSITRLQAESVGILGNCTNPASEKPYSEAGLVLGYVQSGKTQSFTTVTSLARDNGYGVVIVLAGVTNLLLGQSIDRLKKDLGLFDYSQLWKHFENPGRSVTGDFSTYGLDVKERITQWAGNHNKPSLLITILKQGSRIDSLERLLKTLDMSNVPVLIIDDESDQASPNNKSKANLNATQLADQIDVSSSRIHGAVKNLRKALPKHTFLQYTATPQANLLAAKSDVLSPAFARILTPGADYVGGEVLFSEEGLVKYIRPISDAEVINPAEMPDEVPETLLLALRSFWLGCAVQLLEEQITPPQTIAPRSMMIQVSAKKLPHGTFSEWAIANQKLWRNSLKNSGSAGFTETIEGFEMAHKDLLNTYPSLAPLEELIPWIIEALEETSVAIVNSNADAVSKVRWEAYRFWILIGGMKLDRGFTIRGITTTYMPRTLTQNADTLQQRARFFGYHSQYLGLVRIYLSSNVRAAFVKYVQHEIAIRTSLQKFEGKPLSEWKRSFLLDPIFRHATRPSVIGIKSVKSVLKNSWIKSRFLHADAELVAANQATFEKFVAKWSEEVGFSALPAGWIDKRADSEKHKLLQGVPLENVLDFLNEMQFPNAKDQSSFLLLELCSRNVLESGKPIKADVVLVNNLDQSKLQVRELGPEDALNNIFIGRAPKGAALEDLNYVGDDKIYTENITLHLRYAKIKHPGALEPMYVPWVSVRVSEEISTAILEEAE